MAAPSSSPTDLPKHPAKYSREILPVMSEMLHEHFMLQGTERIKVLDPFAGVGGIHALPGVYYTIGSELEWKWAIQGGDAMVQADALRLPVRDAGVDAVVTSPCYGNRMADHHDNLDACSTCIGNGCTSVRAETGCVFTSEFAIRTRTTLKGATHRQHMAGCGPCKKCGGDGRSKRNTYTHQYGEPLRPESAGVMQWGVMYRNFHHEAWQEVWRILKPGGLFICNVSNHIRKGEEQLVVEWHEETILSLGFRAKRHEMVPTRRNKEGANGKLRVDVEAVMSFTKEAA